MFMAVDLHSFKLLYVEFYVFKTKDWLSKHYFSICGLLFDPFYRCEIILCHKVYTRLKHFLLLSYTVYTRCIYYEFIDFDLYIP